MTIAQPPVGARSYLRRNVFSARSGLLVGTALGCSIAILGAASPAAALDECGANVGGDPDAVCTAVSGVGNPYPTGIHYVGVAGEDLTLIVEGDVAVVSPAFDGVTADGATGFDVEVTLEDGATIESNEDGVFVRAFGLGDATVNNAADVSSGQRGVLAFASNGIATVNNTGDIYVDGAAANLYSNGIVGSANYGGVVIDNSGAITVVTSDNVGRGIYAFGYQADVEILNTGDIDVTNDFGASVGIYAGAYGVDTPVSVYSTGAIDLYSVGYSNGIKVQSGFTADVDVFGDITVESTLGGASAITVAAGDAVTIGGAANLTSYADSNLANNYGVNASTVAAPIGTIDIDLTGDITAIGGNYVIGVYASGGGDMTIGVDGTITVGDAAAAAGETLNGWGVYAINTGGAGITINVGDVSVYQDGSYLLGGGAGVLAYTTGTTDIVAGNIVTTGYYADGIEVGGRLDIGGDSTIDVASVSTYGLGSDGVDVGAHGDVYVTAGSIYTAGDNADGLELHSDLGNLYSYTGSIITEGANAHGVWALADAANASIYATDISVYGAGSDGVRVVTGGAGDAFVSVDGDVYSDDGFGVNVTSGDFAAVSVDTTGSVYGFGAGVFATSVSGTTIDNAGSISGGAGLAIDVDGAAASLNNNSDGTIYGAVDLTDNDDTFTNAGTFEAYGTSEFGLGADLLTNSGVVGAERNSGAAGTVTFNGLETFDNAGGLVSLVDGQVGDRLVLADTTFNGSGNSRLGLDVALGGAGSTADVLQITGTGSFTGVTTIQPNDTLAATPGVLNFGGILVVDSANAAETGSEFTMASVDKGFVEYSLTFDAATDNWLIVGLPDDEAFELLAIGQASGDFWRRSGDAWTGRMQEVRDSMGAESPTRSEGWEFWMQAHGGDESFDNFGTFTVAGTSFAQDLSTDSDYRGLQIGADTVSGNFIWGVTGGFVQQETRFQADNNSLDFEGFNVGLYAGMNWGGLYLNALAKGDFFTVDADFTTIPTIESMDGRTYGAQAELGYRFDMGGMFFEPHAQIAWSSTDIDDASAAGADFSFDNNESLYGKAGGRIGGTFGSGDMVITPFVGAYAVEEFEGQNSLDFATGVTGFNVENEARGSYGQAELGLTAQSFYGLEAFAKGEWNFGGDASGGAVRLGARWRW
jgi:hypothetical protein